MSWYAILWEADANSDTSRLHDLCEPESDHGIRRVLQDLPRNLSETYDRLLGKIEGGERRHMIERMFKWIFIYFGLEGTPPKMTY